ncbi:MAG: MFS transporter [Clostridiales bacterium]|nr:MFS transporter [Clostridiales bacterium]
MQKITSRKKLFLYGFSGLGVNMLNLIMGSYLCSALLVGGFEEHVESWTYLNKNLVIAAVWSVMILVAKILDGVIDIPLSSFTDRLKTRWGRRRPAIVIGFVPMMLAYVLFLIPLENGETLLNTIWFGVLLCVYYTFYTLTMLTYYATFSEITEKESDTVFLSNIKSISDVIYFSLGYALIPLFVSLGVNIRYVALIFMPLSLFMLIPLFMLKEKSTKVDKTQEQTATTDEVDTNAANEQKADTTANGVEVQPPLKLGASIACAFKNKTFLYWMLTAAVMNIGLQLFLGGINELFSTVEVNQTIVMATSFAPVPLTILLYNKMVKKFGLGWAFRYTLVMFSLGMMVMFVCSLVKGNLSEWELTAVAVVGGLLASFAIGAFFSVSYTVPSHLAQVEFESKGVSVSSMYFAVEGLIEGIAAGIATGPILVFLKGSEEASYICYMPIVVAAACMLAFAMSFGFSKTISQMGKAAKPKLEEKQEEQ